MTKPDVVLCTPVRTPIASYGGALKDTSAKRGIVTLCIGGGQGIALALEAL